MEQNEDKGSKSILSTPDQCNQACKGDCRFYKGCIDILEDTDKTVVDINDFNLNIEELEEVHLSPSLKARLGLPLG